MTDLLKKAMQFSIGPILGAVISLVTIPLITHFISPEEFGRASMFALVQSLMMSFLYLGIDQAYTREYHATEDKQHLFLNAIVAPFLTSILVLFILGLNNRFFSYLLFACDSYGWLIWLIGIMSIFIVLERFILLTIRMNEKGLEFSFFSILVKSIVLIVTLCFIVFVRRDFLTVVLAAIIGQVSGNMILLVKYRQLFNVKKFKIDLSLFKRLAKFGFPLVFAVGIGSVLTTFDKFSLRLWSDFEQLGVFASSMRLISILTIVKTSFTTFWIPTAYRWYEEKRDIKDYKLISDIILLAMSIIFILLLIFRGIIVWLLSSDYREAQYLFGFLSLFPIMYTISETTTLGIVFSRKSHLNIWVSISSAITSMALNIWLVPNYGALGAAISTGVAYIVFFVARTYFSFKVWEGFPIYKHMITVIIFLAVAFVNLNSSFYVLLLNIAMIPLMLLIHLDITKLTFDKLVCLFQNARSHNNMKI